MKRTVLFLASAGAAAAVAACFFVFRPATSTASIVTGPAVGSSNLIVT